MHFDEDYDNFELLQSKVGELIGINMVYTSKFINNNKLQGVISESSFDPKEEMFTSFYEMENEFENNLLDASFNFDVDHKKYNKMLKCIQDDEIADKDLINFIIEYPMMLLNYFYDINVRDYNCIRRDYFKMLIFDYITKQKDRRLPNFGIVENKDSIRLSGLYDNSGISFSEEDIHYLNGVACYSSDFLNCLFNNYIKEVSLFSDKLVDKKEKNKENILSLSFVYLKKDFATRYTKTVLNKYDEYTNKYEKKRKSKKL